MANRWSTARNTFCACATSRMQALPRSRACSTLSTRCHLPSLMLCLYVACLRGCCVSLSLSPPPHPPTPPTPQWTTRNVHMYTHRRGRAKGACYSAEGEDRAAVCCRWAPRARWHLHAACILRIPRCRPAAISLPTTCLVGSLVGSLVYEQFSL